MGISTINEEIDSAEAGIAALIREAFKQGSKQGYLQALSDFAWWKDGTQYVGCGIKTLKQAQEGFERKGETKNG